MFPHFSGATSRSHSIIRVISHGSRLLPSRRANLNCQNRRIQKTNWISSSNHTHLTYVERYIANIGLYPYFVSVKPVTQSGYFFVCRSLWTRSNSSKWPKPHIWDWQILISPCSWDPCGWVVPSPVKKASDQRTAKFFIVIVSMPLHLLMATWKWMLSKVFHKILT